MKHVIFAAALAALASPAAAQSNSEVRYVKSVLNQLQGPSFQQNREYCGYLGYDSAGRLAISEVVRGAATNANRNGRTT